MKPINVLSLFDGISCGQIALARAGIPVTNYYASEIDKHAIKVTQHNWPETIQLGDVTKLQHIDWLNPKIDLLIGGSPCQGFSFAGKQLNFNDPRSALFFEYVRILKEIQAVNPDVKFFLENVKMKKEYQDVITRILEVDPVEINSSLVSAQNRKRLYWTNIENFVTPDDKGILLADIIHESKDEVLYDTDIKNFNINPSGIGMNGTDRSIHNLKRSALTTNKGEGQKIAVPIGKYIVPFDKTLQILDKEVEKGKVGFFGNDRMGKRVYYIHGKAATIAPGTTGGPKLDKYLFGCITPDRIEKRQNGQRFSEGKKFYTLTAQDKHGILIEGYIRKLTPIECERLQTVPDNYSDVISDSQRYKALGNGWTVDVITEFFKPLAAQLKTENVA